MELSNNARLFDTIYVILLKVLKSMITIICFALSAAFVSYVVADVLYVAQYTSKCTMIVNAKVNNLGVYTDAVETAKLTDTITAVMNSNILKKKTAESIGLNTFDGEIVVSVVTDTNLFSVSVVSDSPYKSFQLLNALLDTYPSVSEGVLGEIIIEVFEEPNFPSSPSNPVNYRKIERLSFLIAGAAVILIYVFYYYYFNSIKTEWDATEKLDAKLISVLYHESHYKNILHRLIFRKKRILIGAPCVSFGFCETIKKIRTSIMFFQEKHPGKVILVTSYNPKEGKTTLAANLAKSLAIRNKRVIIVPGDDNPHKLLEIFGCETPDSFFKETKFDTASRKLPLGNTKLSLFADTRIGNCFSDYTDYINSDVFVSVLNTLKDDYDYIIVDGPSAVNSSATEIWARISDCSVLAVKQNHSKAVNINDTIDMLNKYNNGLIGYVLNDVYTSSSVINVGYGYSNYNKYYSYGKYGKYKDYGVNMSSNINKNNSKYEAKRYKDEY